MSVTEEETGVGPGAGLALRVHAGWRDAMPWLAQGTTTAGPDRSMDLGLFGATPAGTAWERWTALRRAMGMTRVVHARQVHGAAVALHDDGPPGLAVLDETDGHVTDTPGVLLTVSVADCVPVFLVDEPRRAIGILHAGWRGTAAGVLEAGLAVLGTMGAKPDRLRVHLGPAICGDCYEVGPEVYQALGLAVPGSRAPMDLRAVLAGRAVEAGVHPARVTVSTHCTRCGTGHFSHRGGDAGRQLGLLGINP